MDKEQGNDTCIDCGAERELQTIKSTDGKGRQVRRCKKCKRVEVVE